MSAAMILIVGGAVLAPSLLFPSEPVPSVLPVAGDTITAPTSGHAAACEALSKPILQVSTQLEQNTFALRRFSEIMRGVIPFRGSIPGSPGFAKLTAQDVLLLLGEFIAAVKVGVDADAYELGEAGQAFGGSKSQREIFEDITSQQRTALFRGLGGALFEVVAERNKALDVVVLGQGNIATFNAQPALKRCADLAAEMDSQGRPNPLGAVPGVGELFESLGNATENVPSTISDAASAVAGKLGGLVGDTLGGIIFSTPVLLVAVGYLAYRVANK